MYMCHSYYDSSSIRSLCMIKDENTYKIHCFFSKNQEKLLFFALLSNHSQKKQENSKEMPKFALKLRNQRQYKTKKEFFEL